MLKTPYVPLYLFARAVAAQQSPPLRAGCQISDLGLLGGGTRFCRSHAEERAGRRELCETFHVSPPADTETGEAPCP